ncbi:MAG TPA: hypothetical protein ENN55_00540 [Firmicutes bacterium]|nr:hypothetical protein [Bacillota bacterium]
MIADILTIKDRKKNTQGINVAYVGDSNNVANSWLFGAPKAEMNLRIASPEGYRPAQEIVEKAEKLAEESRTEIKVTGSAEEAVVDADVIYTDVWTSMGQEKEAEKRRKDLKAYQVNQDLVKQAKKDVIVMHCLPAHRGEEITDEVMDGTNSVVFEQAENRLHAQKGILALLMGR